MQSTAEYNAWLANALLSCALLTYLPMAGRSILRLFTGGKTAPPQTLSLPTPERTQEDMLQWLAMASHELRTPLAAVLGTIDRLGVETAPDKRQCHLDNLARAGALMQSVIDDILDFSKLEHGAMPLKPTSTDLNALCEGVAALYRPLAEQKQLRLLCDIEGGAGRWLADGARLQQVLGNLVANAVKFTDYGDVVIRAQVAIGAEPNATQWRFEVHDNGIGIAPEVQDRLFTPYMQADASADSRFGGTGLGLSICRHLMEAMGGRIGVTSQPGKGSIFWCDITLTKDTALAVEATSVATTAEQALLPHDTALHILLAEDNKVIRGFMTALLEDAGHHVSCAANGVQVLALVQGRPFDLILMDSRMPVLDGVHATRAIRGMAGPQAHIPIVALTADPQFSHHPMIADLGYVDILLKPVRAETMTRVLTHIAADRMVRRNRGAHIAHAQPTATRKEARTGRLPAKPRYHAKPISQANGRPLLSRHPTQFAQR
ncbi:ATP-binding protein [Aquisediminimonas sediminicola]|uniref:ATP-binding protein n=1 Tax=Alteraquisediminimonas sediminicola TaxID=2676787 RepID=UPI001C8F1BF5|nr:ATP-binding protein [Aquisediminimonas sediminicola]